MSFSRRGGFRNKDSKNYGSVQVTDERSPSPQPVAGLQADENKIAKLRGQVNEVKDIMKDNIEKVIERGEKAQDLSDRTENLAVTSTRFRDSAVDLRKHTQRKNWKLVCCIVCVVVVVLAIAAVIVLFALKII
ncbi:uncharacterized protein LOC132722079 [Ruditapes philippinarum]|uniref:uncharacterized protein LOC132722079 n=1 Tax=Ruditapes philippinarum TaxID=129788 RepID=UPI00295C0C13|nr:uncharacterized protein LOC132722079 [Ruditapes philippinarum]